MKRPCVTKVVAASMSGDVKSLLCEGAHFQPDEAQLRLPGAGQHISSSLPIDRAIRGTPDALAGSSGADSGSDEHDSGRHHVDIGLKQSPGRRCCRRVLSAKRIWRDAQPLVLSGSYVKNSEALAYHLRIRGALRAGSRRA